jgi:hypothetical protein
MSDVLEIPCGGCGRALRVAPEHAGKMARCPVCGHITHVPASLSVGTVPNPEPTSGEGLPIPPVSTPGDTAEWYMKTPEEQTFGPASFQDLERWVQEGRITADCQLSQGAAGNWQPADRLFPSLKTQPTFSPLLAPLTPAASRSPSAFTPSHYPAPAGNQYPSPTGLAPGRYVVPHRGPLILVLALMGLCITCPIFPFMTWVMGSNDLREMQSGRMDPTGRDLTRAGMIIGMVLSILWILGFLIIFGAMFTGLAGN